MGITNEAVHRDREQNILKEEDMVKLKKTKPVSTPKQTKPRKNQFAPTSGVQNHISPSKPQAKSIGGVDKRKKEKPQREYVATTTEDVETKSNEAVKEIKKQDDVDTAKVDNPGEAEHDHLVIDVDSGKEDKEEVYKEKGEVDVEKGGHDGKYVRAEVVENEKGEEKDDKDPVIVARDTNKEKQVVTNLDDFTQGPIDLSSLSPIQALKLATLA
ncbi:uncharacterized protein LOC131875135 [Cryptomeria japonica]|uniref:uncharacterized protein LOC131875135 n=1 Tax=Cryptomeria japonica TaxID=3369 RepID=UPI0027DA8218|nr:uncharacterized protein LOC131875135 [Cryptomeria japonica]